MLGIRNSDVSSTVVVSTKKVISLKTIAVAFLSTNAKTSKLFIPSAVFALL